MDLAQQIAGSFDRTIDLGKAGINQYKMLPPSITTDPDYRVYLEKQIGDEMDSGRRQIGEYFCLRPGAKFLDLGCCLNLINRGYAAWDVEYYGVDLSKSVIRELREFADKSGIAVGGLYCCSMDNLPFDAGSFDLCTCIGSLEYYDAAFVERVLRQVHQVLKSGGKLVLDIPNRKVAEYMISQKIEAYLGRPDRFDLPESTFEALVQRWFWIDRKDELGMIQYFLRRRD